MALRHPEIVQGVFITFPGIAATNRKSMKATLYASERVNLIAKVEAA
jgi:hypothetical protein